jgi:hypothetical protein
MPGGEKRTLIFSIRGLLLASNLGGIERILISNIRYRYTDIEISREGGENV